MYHFPLALQCIYERSNEGGENGDGEEGREWSRLASCMQITWFWVVSRRKIIGRFAEVCRRRCLKDNAGILDIYFIPTMMQVRAR